MDLTQKKCVPCEGGIPKLGLEDAQGFLSQVSGWELRGEKIFKTFKFKTFPNSIQFVNRMADVAEQEGHHPNFCVNFRQVEVTLWTHAIEGLSENDFILAAKIDQVVG